MILIIDNYDSFTHNLARYIELASENTRIVRNDVINVADIKAINPKAIILSPGPCTPKEAGISLELVKTYAPTIPILGVCLGHQCIGEAFGGRTVHAPNPIHGRASVITHDGTGLFQNMPSPLQVGRYHSLITQDTDLTITAQTENGTIMAMQHKHYPTYGVQFHPESILTEHGLQLIENFIAIANTAQKDIAA